MPGRAHEVLTSPEPFEVAPLLELGPAREPLERTPGSVPRGLGDRLAGGVDDPERTAGVPPTAGGAQPPCHHKLSTMTTSHTAAIYIRLSSYRTDDSSTSPERQEQACLSYCEARGWKVAEVIRDLDVSGTARGDRLDRPGLQRLRELYGAVDRLVVMRLDRLSRNMRDYAALIEEFEANGVALASVEDYLDMSSPSGRLVASILMSLAQSEAEILAERTAAGRASARRQGRFTGGDAPYGMQVIDNPAGGGRVLAPDPVEAPIVRELARKYLEGLGTPALARWLNSSGVPTRKGGPWRASIVRTTLLKHAKESAILAGPERHALREALEARKQTKRQTPDDPSSSLLTGVLVCRPCYESPDPSRSGKMIRRRIGAAAPVYICNHQTGESTTLHARIPAEAAEAFVSEAFLDDHSEHRPGVRVILTDQYDLDVAAAKDRVATLTDALATAKREDRRQVMDDLEDAEDALETLLADPPSRAVVFQPGDETLGEKWARGNVRDRRDLIRDYMGPILCTPAKDANGKTLPAKERLTIWRVGDPEPTMAD